MFFLFRAIDGGKSSKGFPEQFDDLCCTQLSQEFPVHVLIRTVTFITLYLLTIGLLFIMKNEHQSLKIFLFICMEDCEILDSDIRSRYSEYIRFYKTCFP